MQREGAEGIEQAYHQRLGMPKTHALNAVCVGEIEQIESWQRPTLAIKASRRGSYQRTCLDRFSFPRGDLMRQKSFNGALPDFQV